MTAVWEIPTQRELNNCSLVEQTPSPDLRWAVGFDDELQAVPAGYMRQLHIPDRTAETVEVLRLMGVRDHSERVHVLILRSYFGRKTEYDEFQWKTCIFRF